jgi:NAD(P)-dependent dehydrogenase (short-subunit alcohol dehydrogenase family)
MHGLGAEIASLLAAAGADLVISGRDPIGLENTRQVVERFGHRCHPVQADQALELFSTIDVLVNNARIVFVEDLLNTTLEHWEATQAVNLLTQTMAD